jgi:hypothetical protein
MQHGLISGRHGHHQTLWDGHPCPRGVDFRYETVNWFG